MVWAEALLLSAIFLTPGTGECAEVAAAHAALLDGSFSVERRFTLKLNGELKAREVAFLTYEGGELAEEILESELLDDNLVLDGGDEESALAVPFACERLERLEAGRYRLTSPEGTETVEFVVSGEGRAALEPVTWENEESTRFLWKKFAIEAVAEYRDFAWR